MILSVRLAPVYAMSPILSCTSVVIHAAGSVCYIVHETLGLIQQDQASPIALPTLTDRSHPVFFVRIDLSLFRGLLFCFRRVFPIPSLLPSQLRLLSLPFPFRALLRFSQP